MTGGGRGLGRAIASRLAEAGADLLIGDIGGLDIWVDNAGIFPSVPLLEMNEDTWDEVFAVRGLTSARRHPRRPTSC
ncbi:hypothetical protein GCM10010191_20780 [Actinomadura vinacea]|uniref:SDR family NAD(P)-dependent oxidoreductase n=1 Tax=Actinomadura vinacea TaxID=115336 RepID=A0ABN3IQJ9_9ACTN